MGQQRSVPVVARESLGACSECRGRCLARWAACWPRWAKVGLGRGVAWKAGWRPDWDPGRRARGFGSIMRYGRSIQNTIQILQALILCLTCFKVVIRISGPATRAYYNPISAVDRKLGLAYHYH